MHWGAAAATVLLLLAAAAWRVDAAAAPLRAPSTRWAVRVHPGRHEEVEAALGARGFDVVTSVPGAGVLAVVQAAAPVAPLQGALSGEGQPRTQGLGAETAGQQSQRQTAQQQQQQQRQQGQQEEEKQQRRAILAVPGVASVHADRRWSHISLAGGTSNGTGSRRRNNRSSSSRGGSQVDSNRSDGIRSGAGAGADASINPLRPAPGRRRLRAASGPDTPPVCKGSVPGDPAREEIVPYSVEQLQALGPEAVAASRAASDRILFCVLDTGMDRAHPDFEHSRISGATTADGMAADWFSPWTSHGTHAAGTIGARRNGFGTVGVHGEGPDMFIANVFASPGLADAYDTLLLRAIELCLQRADAPGPAPGAPNTTAAATESAAAGAAGPGSAPPGPRRRRRAVINMSVGRPARHEEFAAGLRRLLAGREEGVLLFASAGNSGAAALRFPAALPEVVGVAAVGRELKHPHFSQHNPDVELCAGGVDVLSTIKGDDYGHRLVGATNSRDSLVTVNFAAGHAAAAAGPAPLNSPGPTAFEGSGRTPPGGLALGVVDCGAADAPCAGAAGRACLVMRQNHTTGGGWLCSKAINCRAGGGAAVLAWPGPELAGHGDCDQPPGSLVTAGHCPPGTSYLPALGLTRGQGLYLRGLLAAGVNFTVNVSVPAGSSYPGAYGLRSGTSMASPAAAAAAGVVWAAAPGCGASEVRAALAATARDLGPPGRDEFFGHGLVQIEAAIKHLRGRPCAGGGGGGAAEGAEASAPEQQQPRHGPAKERAAAPAPAPAPSPAAGANSSSGSSGSGGPDSEGPSGNTSAGAGQQLLASIKATLSGWAASLLPADHALHRAHRHYRPADAASSPGQPP